MPDDPQKPESQFIGLAGAIGGSAFAIFAIAGLLGGQLWPAAVAVVALAAMGVGIAYFMNKNR